MDSWFIFALFNGKPKASVSLFYGKPQASVSLFYGKP
jgi:hypothetical protein